MIRLHKICPERNQARFYNLHLQPGLFGDMSVVREWGRIGRPGAVRLDWFGSRQAAVERLDAKLGEKQRRGYRIVEQAP